jgi:hypothetical protein
MRSVLLFIIVGVGAIPAFTQSGPVHAPFTITISTEKSDISAGSEVWIRIKMTNTSNHDVDCSSVYVNGVDRRYNYEITDATGASMKKNNEHPELVPGSVQMCTLKPGESTPLRQSRVSWLHDFTKPGKYTIQVTRNISDIERDGVAKSNKITVNVDDLAPTTSPPPPSK